MSSILTFLGAARNVTGSRYLLEHAGHRILIDCGLYQERDFKHRNWDPFPVAPGSIGAVLLTHAHLDHCGYLPRLVQQGFRGPVFSTPATAEIAKIVMLDSAKLQEEDAQFKRKRHAKEGREGPFPEVPLYCAADVEQAMTLFHTVPYEQPQEVAPGITASFHDAGHILGSAIIRLLVGAGTSQRTILFSGDVGRWTRPILCDPTRFPKADYVQIESTYGDRVHADAGSVKEQLAQAINATCRRGGNVIIPSFAVERTQELLYYISELLRNRQIPHVPTFVDSPMANSVTEIYRRHPELQDQATLALMAAHRSPFDFPDLRLVGTVDESKALNEQRGGIIIAGSGMCTGGRIKHHLANHIGRAENTILFVGFQALGTLGRIILDGAPEVRIFGKNLTVRAQVAQIAGFSGHADREELLQWISALKTPPRRVFVTHGEAPAAEALASFLKGKTGWDVVVPSYGESAKLT